jgi:Curli production assembly/transport component CsgG
LRDGANAIDVVADDLVGQQTRARRTVHLDRHGPLLSLEQVEVAGTPPQQRVRVQGLLTDQNRITRFMLAGKTVSSQPGRAWEVREEISLTDGEEFVAFEAEDAAGNVTHGQIALRAPVDTPAGTRQGMRLRHPLLRWTSLRSLPLPLGEGTPVQVAQHRDHHAPVIKLMGLGEQESTVDDSIYLEGQVTDASAIVAFAINGASLWRRNERQLFFGQRFPLQEGENTFVLEAVDEAGNTAQLKVVVTRTVRPVRQMGSRLRVVLLPFAKKGEAPVLAEAVHDYLFNVFVQQRRFDFIERQRLEAILQELTLRQKLTQGALIDPASAAETGKSIATAEGILIGTVTETPQSLEILARFVDVDTAVVLAVGDVYGEELTPPTVKTLVEGLVWKLQRQFPLAEGVVLEKAGKQ